MRRVISLEEMISRLHDRIEKQMKLRFSDLLENDTDKISIVVGFLAVLESVKQGTILVAQLKRFDDIEIEREGSSVPKYH